MTRVLPVTFLFSIEHIIFYLVEDKPPCSLVHLFQVSPTIFLNNTSKTKPAKLLPDKSSFVVI